jgi:hypothetical protein
LDLLRGQLASVQSAASVKVDDHDEDAAGEPSERDGG